MTDTPLFTRALATESERRWLFTQADLAFNSSPSQEAADAWGAYVQGMEDYRPEQLRGVFRGAMQVASCIVYERDLRCGAARLRTVCVGAVVTHPDARMQGAATALMRDVIAFAEARGHALLLLDGIPNFYQRFGYVDVFDTVIHVLAGPAVAATEMAAGWAARPATADDAADVLALYDRHYGPFTGSFTRTLRQQAHRLNRPGVFGADHPLWLAIAQDGTAAGYLRANAQERAVAGELAADSWDAARTLLRQLFDWAGAPETLTVRVPPGSPTAHLLADRLRLPHPDPNVNPEQLWAMQPRALIHRDAAWMARLVDLGTLTAQALPELRARWRRGLAHWRGAVTLSVGDQQATLAAAGVDLDLVLAPPAGTLTATLTPAALVPLLLGYRPLDWAARQPGCAVPEAARAPLGVLFPPGQAMWIAGSDGF